MMTKSTLDDEFIERGPKSFKLKIWVVAIWFLIGFMGYLFRIMHWPWAYELMTISCSGLSAYSVFGIVMKKFRGLSQWTTLFISVSYFLLLLNPLLSFKDKTDLFQWLILYSTTFLIALGIYFLFKRQHLK